MALVGFTQRKYVRYNTDLEVSIYHDAETVKARILQISRGGCLIFPPLPPQPTPHVRMSFHLTDGLPQVNCIGEIVYNIEDKGTGISMTEISEHNQDLITDYFEKRLATEKQSGS